MGLYLYHICIYVFIVYVSSPHPAPHNPHPTTHNPHATTHNPHPRCVGPDLIRSVPRDAFAAEVGA